MLMVRALFLSLAVWLAAPPAVAAEHYAIMGLGVSSCGRFAELSRMDPSLADSRFFDWTQGFMSGLNTQLLFRDGKAAVTKDLNSKTVEAQASYIRNYCDRHPLGDVEKGILELYYSLPDNPH